MTDLVVCNNLLFLGTEYRVFALRTRDNRLHAFLQIGLLDRVPPQPDRPQRRLVDDVCQVRAGRARGCPRDRIEIDMTGHMHVLSVDLQNRNTSLQVGQFDRDAAVKPAWAQQRGVERFRPVGRGQDHNALRPVKTVHFGQKLVERLFTLVVAAKARAIALFTDGINLVNEYDAGRFLARLLEQVAHLGRAHADEHLDKLRAGDREERYMRLTRDRLGKQRFTGTRRADEQRALGQLGTDRRILSRVVEEVYNLPQGLLRLVLSGDVRKGLAGFGFGIDLGVGFAEAHGVPAHTLHHFFAEPLADHQDNDDWDRIAKQQAQQRRGLCRDLGSKFYAVCVQQALDQILIRKDAGFIDRSLPVLVFTFKYDLLLLLVVGNRFHPSIVHHGQEFIIADFGHLPLRQHWEQQPIEQHKHDQCDRVIKNKRFFRRFGTICRSNHIISPFFPVVPAARPDCAAFSS